MASSRCSVLTYSSLKFSAALKAASSNSVVTSFRCGCAATRPNLGSASISFCACASSADGFAPARSSTGATMPSRSSSKAASRCRGTISLLARSLATSPARCIASCAFTVKRSHRIAIMLTSFFCARKPRPPRRATILFLKQNRGGGRSIGSTPHSPNRSHGGSHAGSDPLCHPWPIHTQPCC